MEMSKIIMGIQLQQRQETAMNVQDLLTKYGCYINTRLGVHQAATDSCSEKGLIVLEFIDDADKDAEGLEKELTAINGVLVKTMGF
jgi:hypothetical protein